MPDASQGFITLPEGDQGARKVVDESVRVRESGIA
jgi:hypothetical protein